MCVYGVGGGYVCFFFNSWQKALEVDRGAGAGEEIQS